LGLVKALLGQGKGQEAEWLLDHFPDSPEEAVAEKLGPLARLIVEASNGGQNDAHELDGPYHHAGQLAAQADFTAAMDELLQILRQDKRYRQGEPRQVMLALFELLGESDPLTREYRNKLASVLF
jgi:putative thioredoxin